MRGEGTSQEYYSLVCDVVPSGCDGRLGVVPHTGYHPTLHPAKDPPLEAKSLLPSVTGVIPRLISPETPVVRFPEVQQ